MDYYLGVDGGGSKTYALIADRSGHILGRGRAGNGNHQISLAEAETNVAAACREALTEAGMKLEHINVAHFGLAGADREADFRVLRPMIGRQLPLSRFEISCDTLIALRAGTVQSYGVVLIGGSGFNAAGVSPRGQTFQFGGFGFTYGDPIGGGGSGLSRLAFRAVIREWDGRGPATSLTKKLLNRLHYRSTEEMMHDFLDTGSSIPYDLVKLLFEASAEGDQVARTILREEGAELGNAAKAVIRNLIMERDTFDVVLAGSVLVHGTGDDLIEPIRQAVKETAPNARLVKLAAEPVVGAVLMAMDADGAVPMTDVYDRLQQVCL